MEESVVSLAKAHLRVARPTDNLTEVMSFYRDGLGVEVLYEFNDHDGFDGIMLGHKGAAYHLGSLISTVIPLGGRQPQTISWCSISPKRPSGGKLCSD
jgi:hypothetical protein